MKIAITLDKELVARLDNLVKRARFPSRSQAVRQAIQDKLEQFDRSQLARECAKLDPRAEQELADEGLDMDLEQWPEY